MTTRKLHLLIVRQGLLSRLGLVYAGALAIRCVGRSRCGECGTGAAGVMLLSQVLPYVLAPRGWVYAVHSRCSLLLR